MALQYAAILDKFLDNANLGKVVTEIGSGFALSVPLLMALALWSEISVLPADRYSKIKEETSATEKRIEIGKEGLREIVVEAYQKKDPSKVPTDLDAAYALARHELADMAVRLEILRQQAKAPASTPATGCAKDGSCEAVLLQLGSLHDRLATQKEVVDAEEEHLKTLKNQTDDALSLEKNGEIFTNNLTAVLTFSVIFGVLTSQINRLIFVRWMFGLWFKMESPGRMRTLIKQKKIEKAEADELIAGYYRYMESALNMIWPVLLFGFVFPQYAAKRLLLPINPWCWALASIVFATLLGVSGYYSYKDYRAKQDELIAAATPSTQVTPEQGG